MRLKQLVFPKDNCCFMQNKNEARKLGIMSTMQPQNPIEVTSRYRTKKFSFVLPKMQTGNID